jgi:hypothetical protein
MPAFRVLLVATVVMSLMLAGATPVPARIAGCNGITGATLCLPLPSGWFGSVGSGISGHRPAAWLLAGDFRFPSDAASHEGLPSVPPHRVVISVGDFPLFPWSPHRPRVERLHLPASTRPSLLVRWRVRFSGRDVPLTVRYGSKPTTTERALVNRRLAAIRRIGSWRTFRADGISVRYPPLWHATARRLTLVTYPPQIIAVASYQLPHGNGGADGCSPKEALDRLQPAGAFIFGWEYTQPGSFRNRDFPPRPEHFRLTHFSRYEYGGPSYLLRFRQAGRFFQIHVALGRRASRATQATALRVLDTFHAKPM